MGAEAGGKASFPNRLPADRDPPVFLLLQKPPNDSAKIGRVYFETSMSSSTRACHGSREATPVCWPAGRLGATPQWEWSLAYLLGAERRYSLSPAAVLGTGCVQESRMIWSTIGAVGLVTLFASNVRDCCFDLSTLGFWTFLSKYPQNFHGVKTVFLQSIVWLNHKGIILTKFSVFQRICVYERNGGISEKFFSRLSSIYIQMSLQISSNLDISSEHKIY